MRRDGAENRQKLVEAAREVMRECGGDVALETIAERAGISRTTVYRNFEDRIQLYSAVLEEELRVIDKDLRQTDRGFDVYEVMRRLVELMAIYDRFRGSLPHLKDFRHEGNQDAKMLALIAEPTRRAQEAGLLRTGVAAKDILLACRMIASGWPLDREADRETALSKRLDLLMRGLGTEKSFANRPRP